MDTYKDIHIVFPVHLNPVIQEKAANILGGHPRIHLIQPLDVVDFHNFINRSKLILTDSGGIQEEAPPLGKPVLVLRNTTERSEGIEAGTLKLVGTEIDSIVYNVKLLLDDSEKYASMANSSNPFGDGNASKKIADLLDEKLL